jgi:hypothetical protein
MKTPHRDGNELGEPARARAPDELAPGADVLLSGTADEALSARDLGVDRDTVSDERLSRGSSGGDDLAAEFVTHD